MRTLEQRREDTTDRWRALLRQLGDLDDDLAAEYLLRIDHGTRFYDGVPDEQDLRDAARNAFRYLLANLLGRPLDAELGRFPAEIGAVRARQGIALENLTAAIRTDFLIAWSALLRLADDEDMAVLALHADALWEAVDHFAIAVQGGYLDQRLLMARTSILEQQQSLAELFADDPAPAAVHRAAAVLGLSEDEAYWVIGVRDEDAGRAVARGVAGHDSTPLQYTSRSVTLMLVAAHGRWADDEALLRELPADVVGAVAPRAVPLAEVHRAATTVRVLVELDVAATTLRRSWSRLSLTQLALVIEDLRSYVIDPLRDAHDYELIVSTLLTFAESGSVSDTAAELYCHRNTVMNRIRKFEDVTGVSLRSPRALAMVQLCLLPA
jgi:hypothetical protein